MQHSDRGPLLVEVESAIAESADGAGFGGVPRRSDRRG